MICFSSICSIFAFPHSIKHVNTIPRKQQHITHLIFERLQEELGLQGSESTVRYRVVQLRKNFNEVFIPLSFGPSEASQVDWGTATVIMNGQKTKVQLFCVRLCYSCGPFVVNPPVLASPKTVPKKKTCFRTTQNMRLKDILFSNTK